jgi:hypothetical protein
MDKRQAGEIDLLELIAGFFMALRRNLVLSIVMPLAGILTAIGISSTSKDVFESTLLIETSLLTDMECKFLFEQLDKFGVIPGLTKEQGDQVAGFSFRVTRNDGPILTEQNSYLLNRAVFLEVTAKVHDQSILPALQKSLVDFINGSAPVMRHRRDRTKFYNEMIQRIDREILAMDDIKKEISGKTQATYLNPSGLFENSVNLYEKRTEYEIKQSEITSIHLLKGFDSMTINAGMSSTIAAIIGFAIGFASLCLLLFFQFFFSFYKRYETTH